MKVVVQRVKRASVTVAGQLKGKIGNGLLVLTGIHSEDNHDKMRWVSDKILKMRIFEDDMGKMNCSVTDVGGELLIVSQFTLFGNVQKGTRPGFSEAAPPDMAEPLYLEMVNYLRDTSGLKVRSGEFGAMMDVELVNQGPVTIIIEK